LSALNHKLGRSSEMIVIKRETVLIPIQLLWKLHRLGNLKMVKISNFRRSSSTSHDVSPKPSPKSSAIKMPTTPTSPSTPSRLKQRVKLEVAHFNKFYLIRYDLSLRLKNLDSSLKFQQILTRKTSIRIKAAWPLRLKF